MFLKIKLALDDEKIREMTINESNIENNQYGTYILCNDNEMYGICLIK